MDAPIRVGVVEVGSRAIRLLVADYEPRTGLSIVSTDSTDSKLAVAMGGDAEGMRSTLARIAATVSEFAQRCRTLKANRTCIFGTEALRRLSTAQLDQLKRDVPELTVFDASREALCSLLAAAHGTRGCKVEGEVLSIDQGAASMELALGVFSLGRLKLIGTASHHLGTQPLVEMLASFGGDLRRFRAELERKVASLELIPPAGAVQPILLGSAATKLAWIGVRRNEEDRYDPKLVHGTKLTVDKIDQLIGIAELKPDFVRQVIDPRRPNSTEFETVITGLLALRLVLQKLGTSSFSVSAFGTRHGVAWQLVQEK